MRLVHGNSERIIAQITDGPLAGTYLHISNEGVVIKHLPNEKNSTKKSLEWLDLLVMNAALGSYDPEEGPFDMEFILDLLRAVCCIYQSGDIKQWQE